MRVPEVYEARKCEWTLMTDHWKGPPPEFTVPCFVSIYKISTYKPSGSDLCPVLISPMIWQQLVSM